MIVGRDSERYKKGEALLEAAHAYWEACNNEGQPGAIQWLTGCSNELVVFTRGEYRYQILQNIGDMHFDENISVFAEDLEGDEEDE